MTEKTKRTPEEIEVARAENVRLTLTNKLFQGVIGANGGMSNPMAFGALAQPGIKSAYGDVTGSEDFQKKRTEGYDEIVKAYQEMGVYGEPSMPSNADVSAKIAQQVTQVQQMAKISELEALAKDAGAKLDFEIPEALKGYSLFDVAKEGSKVDDATKRAVMGTYQVLTTAYSRGCTLAGIDYFKDLTEAGKNIVDQYAPAEPAKAKK